MIETISGVVRSSTSINVRLSHRQARGLLLLPVILSWLFATAAPAQNSDSGTATSPIELQSTIVGNQEQPEVIYIVPWKQIDAPAPAYEPLQSMVDGQFELLDRDEWRRKIDLHKSIAAQREESN